MRECNTTSNVARAIYSDRENSGFPCTIIVFINCMGGNDGRTAFGVLPVMNRKTGTIDRLVLLRRDNRLRRTSSNSLPESNSADAVAVGNRTQVSHRRQVLSGVPDDLHGGLVAAGQFAGVDGNVAIDIVLVRDFDG